MPASHPKMQSMLEGIMGSPGCSAISIEDYAAARVPANIEPSNLRLRRLMQQQECAHFIV